MNIPQSSVRSALLSQLAASDYALIAAHLTRVPLPLYFKLHEANGTIQWVYFPEDGLVSVIATASNGKRGEVAIFGSEGMSAMALVLGADHSPHDMYMQIAGVSGLRIKAADLQRAMAASVTLHARLLRYVQTVMVQNASSVLTAVGCTIEQRLARWLIMAQDRIGGDEIKLTHESLSAALGGRRASITVALQSLETQALIGTKRSCVTIHDRDGLERVANGSYGVAEAEYERLMSHSLRRSEFRSPSDIDNLALAAA